MDATYESDKNIHPYPEIPLNAFISQNILSANKFRDVHRFSKVRLTNTDLNCMLLKTE